MTAPAPSFEVISGRSTDAEIDAAKQTDRFIDNYRRGYRDLRNEQLASYYAETPRGRVGSGDGQSRYAVIEDAAAELGTTPASPENFVNLFLPFSAQQNFIDYLGRLGISTEFANQLSSVSVDKIAYQNSQIDRLVGQQEGRGQVLSSAQIAQLLVDVEHPVAIEQTKHFTNDDAPNDAIDADRKAHERIFAGFCQYLRDLLDL